VSNAGDDTIIQPPEVALAIGAHPDDIEFGAGGTLANWARAGTAVHLLILTDGSKGTWDASQDLASLVEVRHDEARAAAKAIGDGTVHFLDVVDGELESGREERAAVCKVIRSVRPEIVLGHDPWQRYRLHPDHRHAGWLTIDGIVAARDHAFFPETGPPHRPDLLLLFEADEPNHTEDIEATFDAKLEALLCHRSQWRSTMGIDASDPAKAAEQTDRFARRLANLARPAGDPRLVEQFRLVRDL